MNNNNNFNKEEFIQRLVESATEYENKYRQSLDETSKETKLKIRAAMKSRKYKPQRASGGEAGDPGMGGKGLPGHTVGTDSTGGEERGLKKPRAGSNLDAEIRGNESRAARSRLQNKLKKK